MVTTARHPNVPFRSLPLTEEQAEVQKQRGLYTTSRGVWLPIPVDNVKRPNEFLSRDVWRTDHEGRVFRAGARMTAPKTDWQRKLLTFLRDHVNANIPYMYYRAVLGHDLHVATWGDLYAQHFHLGWANPFNPDEVATPMDKTFETMFATHFVSHECDLKACPRDTFGSFENYLSFMKDAPGFIEDCGWLSGGKVTDAFVSEEIDELVSATGTEYADFDFHEVGTSSQAENNNDTALILTTSIARATGTPTDSDPIFQNVATITADATESWEEHGLFNNSTGAALMDRSLTGGQSVNSSDQVQYTYQLTKNPEA